MVTMAQRLEELRTERNLSRPALSAALGLPRMAIEKFETGRQTPTQEQQEKIASFFGVSTVYLSGDSKDRTQMEDWMDGAFLDAAPAAPPAQKKPSPPSPSGGEQGTVFDSFLSSKKFQEALRGAVMDVLRSPEGREALAQAVRKELSGRR